MYSKEIIERIKSSVNIVDVISDYQTLQRRGKHWLGICPFHQDSTPSLTVNPVMQIYKCFACGAAGDVISYVEHAEGCTFSEALLIVAKRGKMEHLLELEDESEEARHRRLLREKKLSQSNARLIATCANLFVTMAKVVQNLDKTKKIMI
ncbi:MAG: hypothetical protein IJ169_04440, partial [Paludibacteraceae bacterium]|nr:hypothetical protein [Paludibacteraceae bacterium]